MNLQHDLLFIDLEFTGLNVLEHEIVQLSAILLDQSTLAEKSNFSTYINPGSNVLWSEEAAKVNGITNEMLKDAPDLSTALKQFSDFFPSTALITNYGGTKDGEFLNAAYFKTGIKNPFHHRMLDIWPLCYFYISDLIAKNLIQVDDWKNFRLVNIAKHFEINTEGAHDGLVDCRIAAEVLRKLGAKIQFN